MHKIMYLTGKSLRVAMLVSHAGNLAEAWSMVIEGASQTCLVRQAGQDQRLVVQGPRLQWNELVSF